MFSSPGQQQLMGRLANLIAGRSVLASDIANLDTPGYQGQGNASFQASLAATLTRQLGGTAPAPASGGVVSAVPAVPLASTGSGTPQPATGAGGGVLTPDGNGMSLDALMAQLAQNDLNYQAVSRQVQLTYTNLSEAIDKGGA